MGDMADFANDYQNDTMDEYYDYMLGRISIDPWEQQPQRVEAFDLPMTAEEIDSELYRTAASSGLTSAYPSMRSEYRTPEVTSFTVESRNQETKTILLNAEAVANLQKENPTCNICRQEMTARHGRYGKFYFCANQCAGQGTVSDTYWQKIKKAAGVTK